MTLTKFKPLLIALLAIAFALFPTTTTTAQASTWSIDNGTVYYAYEHTNGSDVNGCIVYITRLENYPNNPPHLRWIEVISPVLIVGADQVPCSTLYRIGRRLAVTGHLGPEYPEGTYLVWKSR